jgi:hypothetical protein
MKTYRAVYPTIAMVVAAAAACDDAAIAPAKPGFGQLRIVTSEIGSVPVLPPGPEYYRFRLDGRSIGIVHIDSTKVVDSLAAGTHFVAIDLERTHCSVPNDSVAAIVAPAETTTVRFDISCHVNWGHLQVALPTTGPNQPNLLVVSFDGEPRGGASPNTAGLGFPYVPAGTHAIGLSGYGANCALAESNPQNVLIPPGETLQVTFTLTCN